MNNHSSSMRGGALILVVLLMLALSMFGLLSMYSAHSDHNLAEKRHEWLKGYYELDNMGQYELYRAKQVARDSGFESLTAAGWQVSIGVAEKIVQLPEVKDGNGNVVRNEGWQKLRITVKPDGKGGLSALSWIQFQDPFEVIEPSPDIDITPFFGQE